MAHQEIVGEQRMRRVNTLFGKCVLLYHPKRESHDPKNVSYQVEQFGKAWFLFRVYLNDRKPFAKFRVGRYDTEQEAVKKLQDLLDKDVCHADSDSSRESNRADW